MSRAGELKVRRNNDYRRRNLALLDLGFQSYAEYLGSELWETVRGWALERTGACFGCGRQATEVHHREYTKKALLGKKPAALVPICSCCHREIEFSGGEKSDLRTANARLDALHQRSWKRLLMAAAKRASRRSRKPRP